MESPWRKQDIQTLPNLVSDLAGGHYKKYRFFVFNFGIKQVQIEQYILGSASQPIVKDPASQKIHISSMIDFPTLYLLEALGQSCRISVSELVACVAFSRFFNYACR